MTTAKPSRRLILFDGHALLFRAYHAMPPFTTPDGRPSGAVYGFANVLIRVLRELEPTWLITCFDAPGPTFRDELYVDYKATRAETPADLITQEPMVKDVLEAFGVPHLAVAGWEADDLIATLVAQALENDEFRMTNSEVIMVTGDRDLLQLSRPKVKIYLLRNGTKEITLLDEEAVTALVGLPPNQLLDWKALRGDPSDNIKGVPGVGDKTALALIKEFGNLETLYSELESPKSEVRSPIESPTTKKTIRHSEFIIRNLIRDALLTYQERVFQNKDLMTVRTDAPITLDLAAADRHHYRPESARAVLTGFGFKGILARLPAAKVGHQPSLFTH